MKHYKYTSIGQFRNIVKDVNFTYKEKLPTLTMTGTVKVHGTNASVVIKPDGSQYAQSRNNAITLENDNCGFARWAEFQKDCFLEFGGLILDFCEGKYSGLDIVIYGEWAGKGIQKNVAVSELGKFFYIFGVKIVTGEEDGDHIWLKDYPNLTNGSDIIDSRE